VETFRTRRRDEWLGAFAAAGVPCGAVRDIGEALADPQVAARDMVQQIEHVRAGLIKVLGLPIKLSHTPGAVRTAPPVLGEHTRQVLEHDLHMTAGEIDALEREGVIACP
jgi:crotonobetainyl-CoA:carnitine CoA-transferase CaiB-like acyl-CoA transferase